MCESFHCLPTRALWELEHDPDRMALRILPLRAYADTKARIDVVSQREDAKPEDMPTGELADLVLDIEAELTKTKVDAEVQKRLAALADDEDD